MARFLLFFLYLTFVEIVFTMDEDYNTCSQIDCAGKPNNGCCLCNTIDDCKVSDPEMADCTDLDNGYRQVCVCTHPYTWDGVSCVTITKEYQSSPWSAEKPIVYHEYKLFGKARILFNGNLDRSIDNSAGSSGSSDGDDDHDDNGEDNDDNDDNDHDNDGDNDHDNDCGNDGDNDDDDDGDNDHDNDDGNDDDNDDDNGDDDDDDNDNEDGEPDDVEIPCEPGTYHSSSSPDPGSNSDVGTNIAECKLCAPGHYQDRSGMDLCIPCGTGKFQNEAGKIECKNCDVFCTECNSLNGSCFSCIEDPGIERKGNACVCKDGYYQVQENAIKQCRPCHPLCATCSGPSFSECDSCQNSLGASDNSCVIYCDSLPGYYISENSCEGFLLF